MARIKQKGKAGAAKAYVTRSAAVKRLQCSLADFRRLCILKGIFPREPRHKKRANKGSSVPTTFYYAKDIAYLAHEPVLRKLREHKAFAKKLARALGRGEWSSAKSLEDNKPTYTLDHVIKERYPTFIDALRDIDDPLCLITLFASLPSNTRVSQLLIENCCRLSAEWQLYIIHTRALRKVFLSIKGVYFQAEVMDQSITWLVPYQFTQSIPPDVDVRVMLTFLELYQTLLGFVFFKLYTDVSLVYPPPMDSNKDETGAGIGAYILKEVSGIDADPVSQSPTKMPENAVSGKNVRQAIKAISSNAPESREEAMQEQSSANDAEETEEDFVLQPSTQADAVALPTYKTLSSLPQSLITSLFAPYTFYISREVSRPLFEFMIRSFGGRVGWPATSGSGSPIDEADESITHVIIDRPNIGNVKESSEARDLRLTRKFVQPQWVADCINAGKILIEDLYAPGKILPPHLSPFAQERDAYEPEDAETQVMEQAMGLPENDTGRDKGSETIPPETGEQKNMNKMMMSKKQRKLYEKLKKGQDSRVAERTKLKQRRETIKQNENESRT